MDDKVEIVYIVHSDVDENNILKVFSSESEAIAYARDNSVDETWVDKVTYYPNKKGLL